MRGAMICEPVRTAAGGFGGVLRGLPVHELAAAVVRAVPGCRSPPQGLQLDRRCGRGFRPCSTRPCRSRPR